MFVQVHTDNHLKGGAGLSDEITGMVESSLSRFAERITEVKVGNNQVRLDKIIEGWGEV